MIDKERIAEGVRLIIEGIGEDPEREGIRDTPERVAEMYAEIFSGIYRDPKEVLNVEFDEDHEELVLVRDIPFFSVCEHHLLPFYGKAHVAYIPRKGKITGISKLVRVVEVVSKRPQLQERMSSQIADAIYEKLRPYGVAVVVEAEHLCMVMRGVKSMGALVVTSAIRGVFRERPEARAEVFNLLLRGKRDGVI